MNRKLQAILVARIRKYAVPPFTEAGLGELLKEIRRLLEAANQKNQYPMLKLFCDWAAHAKLSGPRVQTLLCEMDADYDSYVSGPTKGQFPSTLGDFLSLHGFKNELSTFLQTCGVTTPHVMDKRQWEEFEQAYCAIVGDCLLSYENKKKPLKHLDSAVISIVRPHFNPAQLKHDPITVPSAIQWIFFKDNKEAFRLLLTWGSKTPLTEGLHL